MSADNSVSDWTPSSVSMREFLAVSPERASAMVPEIPAIYYWVVDFNGPMRSKEEWEDLLRRLSSLRGPVQRANSISHIDLECYVSPEAIDPAFGENLVALARDEDLRGWIGRVLSVIQRPLYVGITTNLSQRVDGHLNDPDGLNDKLGSQLDISECALIYFELPDPLIAEILRIEFENGDPTSTDHLSLSETDRLLLPRALRVVEYVALRTSMPTFNRVRRSQ